MNPNPRIAFIGGGNMARSLIGGLLQHGFSAAQLSVAEPNAARREALHARFQVAVGDDNRRAIRDADAVVFAVKPQVFRAATRPLAAALAQTRPLIVSIAAGITEPDIRRWLGFDAAIVRVMPNTPALIGAGAAVLYANRFVNAEQRALAERMLKAVGQAWWVEEEKYMDAVTAVSGCGPAYYFLVMEAMEAAGRELGLPAELAHALVLQTAYGAARMALESSDDPATLRKQVTSPSGTTAAALKVLEDAHLREIFQRALSAACERGAEMAREFGKDPA